MSNKTYKVWNINVQGTPCTVELKNNKIVINQDEGTKLNKLPSKNLLYGMHTEYFILVNGVGLSLYMGVTGGPLLVMNNINCATGEEYIYQKFPKWGYIFFVLHLANLMNGAIGGVFAFLGAYLTISIMENNRTKTPMKVLLNILALIAMWIATFVTAFVFLLIVQFFFA